MSSSIHTHTHTHKIEVLKSEHATLTFKIADEDYDHP